MNEGTCHLCGDAFTDDDPEAEWINDKTGERALAHGEGDLYEEQGWRLA